MVKQSQHTTTKSTMKTDISKTLLLCSSIIWFLKK